MIRTLLTTVCTLSLLASVARAQEAVLEVLLKPDATNPLMYDKKTFTVKAGQKVKLTLENKSVLPQPHNLLILKPGTMMKVGALANSLVSDPKFAAQDYVPTSDDVLHHTKLIQPGQSASLEFTAPAEAGDYPYICTFPGHWMLMNGTMKVEK